MTMDLWCQLMRKLFLISDGIEDVTGEIVISSCAYVKEIALTVDNASRIPVIEQLLYIEYRVD